ncbi:hypothetical protein GGS21DRAFT_528515 [Xylaria nigripes]|nr:hypothetical protein GGS21DRAFT_528515 [Xylaria nigripes]
MAESLRQVESDNGEASYIHTIIENEGWSALQPILGFSSSTASSRARCPPSLSLQRTEVVTEDMKSPSDLRPGVSAPAFDHGLGCFGYPYKVVETGQSEPMSDSLCRADTSQIKTTQELFDGKGTWGDDCSSPMLEEGECPVWEDRIYGGQDLLEELDDLEAARPKQEKEIVIPGNRDDIWERPNLRTVNQDQLFGDWIDEVAALEASVSMPQGTRYYTVNDPTESNE